MRLDVAPLPRPEWTPLPHDGCIGVEGKVLLRDDDLVIAMLRFTPGATIHEHAAPHEIDVVCLEGRGRTSVGAAEAPLHGGQHTRWPRDVPHRLWTDDSPLTTLMVERLRPANDL